MARIPPDHHLRPSSLSGDARCRMLNVFRERPCGVIRTGLAQRSKTRWPDRHHDGRTVRDIATASPMTGRRSLAACRSEPAGKSFRSARPARAATESCSNVPVGRTRRTSAPAPLIAANMDRRPRSSNSPYLCRRQTLEITDSVGGLTLTDHLMRSNLPRERLRLIAVSAKRWMPREDSNLNRRYQKPQSYH